MQLDHTHHQRRVGSHPLVLVLDNVHDPLNVGSLFRLADALGVAHLYLCGATPVPPRPAIRKMSRGTDDLVPYTYTSDTLSALKTLKADGYECIALEITTTSQSMYSYEPRHTPVAVVVGSESAGVSDEVLAYADRHFHIDLDGTQSSMNVAMAAAIGAYEIIRHMKKELHQANDTLLPGAQRESSSGPEVP